MNVRAEITVRGFVQGVGYRRFAEKRALELQVKGRVRNEENGDVFCLVEGDRATLEKFIQRLHQGPSFSRVRDVKVVWAEYRGEFSDFLITV